MRMLRRVSPKLAPTGSASFSEPPATHIRTLNSSRSCLKVVETFRIAGGETRVPTLEQTAGAEDSPPDQRRA